MNIEHVESLEMKWLPLLEGPEVLPAVLQRVLQMGGTRPAWITSAKEQQNILMAWPPQGLLRAAAVMRGDKGIFDLEAKEEASAQPAKGKGRKVKGKKAEEQLETSPEGQEGSSQEEKDVEVISVFPFMEGIVNDLTVEAVHPWSDGCLGEVLVQPNDEGAPLWLFDPLFFRDQPVDLTPGVLQTFLLSGLCFGIRRALLDDMTVTEGPVYDEYAKTWLEKNPDKHTKDVPPLKINLRGTTVLGPASQRACEYQARCTIGEVTTSSFGPEGAEATVYVFPVRLGSENAPFYVQMYAAGDMCYKGYVPKNGDEVDMVFWLQGRLLDFTPDEVVTPAMPAPSGD